MCQQGKVRAAVVPVFWAHKSMGVSSGGGGRVLRLSTAVSRYPPLTCPLPNPNFQPTRVAGQPSTFSSSATFAHSSAHSHPPPFQQPVQPAFARNASCCPMLCSWTNPPAELILRHRPCWLIGVASSLLFRLLFLFCFLLPTASGQLQKSQSQLLQPPMSTQFPGNLTELTGLTIEPNWPLEEFDQRRPAKRRHSNGENALTSRYGLRIDHCPDGGQPEQDSLNGQVKLCQLDDECRPSYKCQNIIGLTHFGKQMRYCCPTKTTACTERPKLEPIIPGRCRPLKIFYYFDVDQLTCVKARMAQCEDFGRNRFASELECRTKCETTACELGESILLHNSSFDKPFVCESDEDCPVGYNCRQDRIFRRSVCCGFLDFEPCPLGFRSFTVPFSGRPKSCVSSDTRDECPTDYVCTQNQINQEHYCCTVEKGVCPDGHQAYIHPLTDGTIKCNLHGYESTTACPPGYACLAAVFGSPWGFCCSQAVVASCPEDSFPQINPLTNQPKRCELMQLHSCSKGFVCESDSASHLGFCCSIPRRFTKKRTHPAELIPRKKIRPKVPITTEAPPEEEEMPVVEETALTTMPPPSPPPQTMPTTQAPTQTTTMPTTSGRGGRRKGEGKRRGGGKGRRKKKNRPRSGGGRKRARSREEEGETAGSEEAETQNPSSSSALESNEMQKSMERHELNSLSTKLDRFITGIRRKSELPSGHRGKPHIWRLKKGWGRGQSKMTPAPRRVGETEEVEEEEHGEGEETEEEQKAKKSRTRRPPRPKCPFGYDPMAYPGTKWTYLECLLPPEKRNGKKMKKKKKRPRKREEDEENVFRKEAEDEEVNEEEEGEENGDEKGGSEERHQAAAICPEPAICMPAKEDPFMRALCCVKKGEEEVEDTKEEEASEEGRKLGRRKKGRRKDLAEEDENDEDDEGRVDEEAEEAEEEAEVEEAEDGLAGKSEVDTTAPTTTASSSTTTTTTTTTAMTTTTSSRPSTRPPPALSVLMVEKSSDATCPRLIADRTCKPGSARDCREPGFFCQFNKDKRQFVCCSKNL